MRIFVRMATGKTVMHVNWWKEVLMESKRVIRKPKAWF
jgi:hypothetical protein